MHGVASAAYAATASHGQLCSRVPRRWRRSQSAGRLWWASVALCAALLLLSVLRCFLPLLLHATLQLCWLVLRRTASLGGAGAAASFTAPPRLVAALLLVLCWHSVLVVSCSDDVGCGHARKGRPHY